jgi:hypothetical protein
VETGLALPCHIIQLYLKHFLFICFIECNSFLRNIISVKRCRRSSVRRGCSHSCKYSTRKNNSFLVYHALKRQKKLATPSCCYFQILVYSLFLVSSDTIILPPLASIHLIILHTLLLSVIVSVYCRYGIVVLGWALMKMYFTTGRR